MSIINYLRNLPDEAIVIVAIALCIILLSTIFKIIGQIIVCIIKWIITNPKLAFGLCVVVLAIGVCLFQTTAVSFADESIQSFNETLENFNTNINGFLKERF